MRDAGHSAAYSYFLTYIASLTPFIVSYTCAILYFAIRDLQQIGRAHV